MIIDEENPDSGDERVYPGGDPYVRLSHTDGDYDTLTGVFMTVDFPSASRYPGQIYRRTMDIYDMKASINMKH